MNATKERSVSLWMATARIPASPPLRKDVETHVAVVGTGIAGLSTAYELSKLGVGVVVIDRGEIGGGMTSRTSAHLTSNIDDLFQELIRVRGEDEARSYYRARKAAIDRIEAIQAEENIACDFARLDGYLFPAKTGDEETLQAELDACRRVGMRGVKWVDQAPIRDAGVGRSLMFPNQARFHPRKYLAGLARAIKARGGLLYADTPVVDVKEHSDRVLLKTERGPTVSAQCTVVATNSPIHKWLAIHTKQSPYRTYVIAGKVPRRVVTDALYWDTLDPYHFVRLQPAGKNNDWLLVGGEDHRTAEADDADRRLAKLEAWARSLVPMLGEIEYRWSGQVLDTVDYLPFSGLSPGSDRIFLHTGDSGEGLTNGVIGSLLLRDLARDRKHRWSDMLNPGRVTLKSATRFVSENLSVPKNLAAYLTPGEITFVETLKRDHGAVVDRKKRKVAAYRDTAGKLHFRSASCTHSGCLIRWNSFERCWDCTCHGSHFSAGGEPLNAPAIQPLPAVSKR